MDSKKASFEQVKYALFRNGVFDEILYLSIFSDIKKGVAEKDFKSGLHHWLLAGMEEIEQEKRTVELSTLCELAGDLSMPSFKIDERTYRNFSRDGYLYLNPDVSASNSDPLEHWLKHGRLENRATIGVTPFATRETRFDDVLNKPIGINVFGMQSAPTGLGKASRGYCMAIDAVKLEKNYHEVSIDQYALTNPRNTLLRTFTDERVYKVSFILQNADMMPKFHELHDISLYDNTYKIGGWVWELPQFRTDWGGNFGGCDEIWVPSEFCRAAIQPMTRLPVTVIPYVVSIAKPDPKLTRKYFKLPEKSFIFGYIFDVSSTVSRKNPYVLIRAFKNAFKANANVVLVLKIHAPKTAKVEVDTLQAAIAGDARIILINTVFSDAENDGFKRCIDCFVSPHRSEGFGLNIAEMMLLGKPVIATGYSGSNDFFDDQVGYPIQYKMVEVERWVGPYAVGMTWADPDGADLGRLMQHVLSHPEEAKAKALKGQKRIWQNYSAEAVGKLMIARLQELGLDREIPEWIRSFGLTKNVASMAPLAEIKDERIRCQMAQCARRPIISLIVPVYNIDPAILRECIESVHAQSYPNWELCMVDDCSTKEATVSYVRSLVGQDSRYRIGFLDKNLGISGCMNEAVTMASGEFIAFLDNDDVIHPDALLRVVQEINHYPSVDVMYSDEMKLDEKGARCDSYYKPDFSREHLESVMYWLHFFVVRKRLFHELGGFREKFAGAQDYDLALRLSCATTRIAHIDEPLYCWRKIPGSASATVMAKPTAMLAGKHALEDYAKVRYGANALVESTVCTGIYQLRKFARVRPKVTLVICTDNRSKDIEGRGYINMLRNFYDSIIEQTSYPDYDILIADNGSCSVEADAGKAKIPTRVIHYREKKLAFNFAEKINWVVKYVENEYFVILNDDMEICSPMWLDYLMDQIQDNDVGVVGAKLLTSLGTIQHVGVVITNDGAAKHVYHGFPADFVGYNGYTHVVRNFSAVTGACLATRKSLYDAVGGFDEQFAIDYNDIDFCLKVHDLGYRVVLNPNVIMYHFENATVPRSGQNPAETALFRSRWGNVIKRDPYYNKNLSQIKHDFSDALHVDEIYTKSLVWDGSTTVAADGTE